MTRNKNYTPVIILILIILVVIFIWFFIPNLIESLNIMLTNIPKYLENIFDWNVKQLFLYLSAEYSTKNNVSTCVEVFL